MTVVLPTLDHAPRPALANHFHAGAVGQWGAAASWGWFKGRGTCVAAAMCLTLTLVEGEGYWRLMGTTRVVDAAASSLRCE